MMRTRALGAVSGLLAALSGVGAAEGIAASLDAPSPVVAVGTWAIDRSPAWLREFAIEHFGVNDKHVLVGGMLATIAVLGVLSGTIGVTRPRVALGLAAGTGAVGVLASATARGIDDTPVLRILPALIALVVATASLAWLLGALGRSAFPLASPAGGRPQADPRGRASVTDRMSAPPEPVAPAREMPAVMIPARRPPAVPGLDRRAFVRAAGAVGLVGVAGGTLWQASGGSYATTGLVRLPRPSSPARAVTGADFNLPGLTPYFTANPDFYRIDTALVVPRLDLDHWELRIHGMVERPVTLSFDDLLSAKLIERDVTLTCVSNEIGGHLNSTARWLGVRIAEVLRSVGVKPGADAVKSTSADGWTSGTPLSALTDPKRDAMFAIGMNGDALPAEHGFPVRMVVPGLYGFVSAIKWIVDFEVTRFDAFEAYWTQRGWAVQAPIKTQSRIELPQPSHKRAPGPVTLAGMAWAPHRGISKVEVRIDDGEVRTAELAPWNNADTWRQWRVRGWEATPSIHTIKVRAIDGTGAAQSAVPAEPIPDGASGFHTVQIPVV